MYILCINNILGFWVIQLLLLNTKRNILLPKSSKTLKLIERKRWDLEDYDYWYHFRQNEKISES